VVKVFPHEFDVVIVLADDAITARGERALVNYDEAKPVGGYQFGFALVVESSLLA
jgi:hypothetical protein